MDRHNEEKSDTIKKPFFRKPPVVKQTLTSMCRIPKANSSMLIKNDKDEGNNDDFSVNKIKLPKSIFQPTATHTAKEHCTAAPVSKNPTTKSTVKTKIPSLVKHHSRAQDNKKNAVSNPQPRSTNRRSLSAERYDCQRKLIQVKIEQVLDKNPTQSLSSIQKEFAANLPIVEEKRVTFKTPIAYRRRSLSVDTPTPYHSAILSYTSTPTPAGGDLLSRLENWLRKHKKPAYSFHYLRCVGVDYQSNDEDKENIKVADAAASSSNETPKAGSSGGNSREVARGALEDLHKLIIEGYSREQCEAWLEKIRHNYQYLEKEPQYWECRIAINVKCLQAAIIQGTEVGAVDHSVEQLLEKFSVLTISTSESPV